MTDPRDNVKLELISEEAAEWFVRLKDRDVDSADLRQYVRWLKQSPVHVAEFLRACQHYGSLRRAELPACVPEDEAASNVVELAPRERAPSERLKRHEDSSHWKISAAVSVFTLSFFVGVIVKVAWFDRTIETKQSEWRQIALADGSVVRLGPHTQVRLKFSDERRCIDLSRGEAVFQVAKDVKRPFLVNTEFAVIRAVGTQFGVSRRQDRAVVTVAEGKVSVTRAARPGTSKATTEEATGVAVKADQQVSVSLSLPIVVKNVSATRELAWARQRLIFETETIAQAVDEFNRRNNIQMAVDDPGIATLPVCCVFDAADPESFAEAMAADPEIALVHDPSGVLRLVPEAHIDAAGAEGTTIQADAF